MLAKLLSFLDQLCPIMTNFVPTFPHEPSVSGGGGGNRTPSMWLICKDYFKMLA